MSDDSKNLPAPQRPRGVAKPREEYLTSPVSRHSLLGRVWSRFVAGLNTKTIQANTEQVRALKEYGRERGELADVSLDADRRIANYVHHRDDIIDDDHAAHLARMEGSRVRRELDRQTREEMLKTMQAENAKRDIERELDPKIARQAKEAELAQAEWQSAKARWGRDAFEQSMPFRKERIEHLYKTGALDAEIERLISEGGRDKQKIENAPRLPGPASADASIGMLEQLLAELDLDIETAHATHASDDHKAALYAMRARLSARLASAKGS